jgi:hypothetical protein
MAAFTKENQPAKAGRKKGSLNKKSSFPDTLQKSALAQLTLAVANGESYAIQIVMQRCYPALKPVSVGAELDNLMANTELTNFKIKELSDFEKRIEELEQAQA